MNEISALIRRDLRETISIFVMSGYSKKESSMTQQAGSCQMESASAVTLDLPPFTSVK